MCRSLKSVYQVGDRVLTWDYDIEKKDDARVNLAQLGHVCDEGPHLTVSLIDLENLLLEKSYLGHGVCARNALDPWELLSHRRRVKKFELIPKKFFPLMYEI